MGGAFEIAAPALSALAALGAAAVGGLFFGFSNFIMAALARRPAGEGMAAMQAINVTVLNPALFALLFGPAVLAAAAAALAPSTAALAAVAVYALGCIGVTGTRNVPLNEKLRRADPQEPGAEALWRDYLRRWTRWNHLRAAACFASAGLALAA